MGQASHGSPSRRSVQLTALARMRAVEVLPVPRGPTNSRPWPSRPEADRVAKGLDDGPLADHLRRRSGHASGDTARDARRVACRPGSWARPQDSRRDGAAASARGQLTGRAGWRVSWARPAWSGCPPRQHEAGFAVHPLSTEDVRGPIRSDRLGPGRSAAPGEQRLTLLPSGPDVVHASPLRGTRSSTPLAPSASANAGLERGFSPAEAVCRYRAPLVPRLARPADDSPSGATSRGWAAARVDGQDAYSNWRSSEPVGVVRRLVAAADRQRGTELHGRTAARAVA